MSRTRYMAIFNQKWGVLIATALSCVLVGIDFTIINTCLPNIQHEFHISINQLQWMITGFGLTFSTLLIGMGRLGDLYGYRKLLYIGIIGFTVTSLAAGLSQTGWQLIMMRFSQGIFGAMLFPAGISLTSLAFPSNEQGRALGLFGSLLGLGMAIGPVLGGVITHFLSWRWIFFVNIPIALLSILLCSIYIFESPRQTAVKMDWWGLLFLLIALSSFTLAVNKAQEWGWTSITIISLWILTVISLIIFIQIENRIKMPLLPFKLMKNYSFFLGNIIFIISVSFSWVTVFLFPLYLQNVRHYSSLDTGLILLFMTLMVVIMPVLAGHWLDKKGSKVMTFIAFIVCLLAYTLLLTLHAASHISWIIILLMIAGVAWGIGNGLGMPIALSGTKDPGNAGVLSGVTTTSLNVFAVITLSIATAIFHFGESRATQLHLPTAQIFMQGFHEVFIFLIIATLLLAIFAYKAVQKA